MIKFWSELLEKEIENMDEKGLKYDYHALSQNKFNKWLQGCQKCKGWCSLNGEKWVEEGAKISLKEEMECIKVIVIYY